MTPDEWTALALSCALGHAECAALLFEFEATVPLSAGLTALHVAAFFGATECVKLLIPVLAGQRSSDEAGGYTAMMIACDPACVISAPDLAAFQLPAVPEFASASPETRGAIVQLLKGTSEVGMTNSEGATALMLATEHRLTACVVALADLEAGAQDEDGVTALHVAVRAEWVQGVSLLFVAESGLQDVEGNTALHIAASTGNTEIAGVLIPLEAKMQAEDGAAAIHLACCHDQPKVALLLSGREGQMVDHVARTPLHYACSGSSVACARLFDGHAGAFDDMGDSGLILAARSCSLACARVLLHKEAGMRNASYETALLSVAESDEPEAPELVTLLLPTEYDLTSIPESPFEEVVTSEESRRRVLQFIQFRHISAVTAADLAARFDEVEDEAKAAYRIAAQTGLLDVVKALSVVCSGTRYYRGRTALMYAVEQNQTAVVEFLLDLEVGIQDDDGWTALMHACDLHRPECVALLAFSEHELRAEDGLGALSYCRDDCTRATLLAARRAVPSSLVEELVCEVATEALRSLGKQVTLSRSGFKRSFAQFLSTVVSGAEHTADEPAPLPPNTIRSP
jgi:ankyrin repeat protein